MGQTLVAGFATSLAVWCAWFITHLPWLGIPEQVSMPILLAVWLVAAAFSLRIAGVSPRGGRAWKVGVAAGLTASALGLLILGSKLGDASGPPNALMPSWGLIAAGFMALGAAAGAAGVLLARLLPAQLTEPRGEASSAARMAIVAVVAVTPLLSIGGLVTSTNSGMAVPDWPNTYGSNMFLYPLGPRAAADVYLEHSHRLFGTLAGLAAIALMILTVRSDDRRWVRRWAIAIFAFIVLQGLLGGVRVLLGNADIALDNRFYSMAHGILAQFLFAMMVALAVFLAPSYRALPSLRSTWDSAAAGSMRRLRVLATGATHATLLQLVFGAAYRHLRADHALWTHAAFSVVVVIFATGAGFLAMSLSSDRFGATGRVLRAVGVGLVAVVIGQFALGWLTFFVGGRGHEAASVAQALVRTVHQANGALLLALATMAYMWARAAAPRSSAAGAEPAPSDRANAAAAGA